MNQFLFRAGAAALAVGLALPVSAQQPAAPAPSTPPAAPATPQPLLRRQPPRPADQSGAPTAAFEPMSSNVKVYGAIYSAESCSYDPAAA